MTAAGSSPFSLDGRRVLILGGSSGIGAETAGACARAGARVTIAARRADRLASVLATLPGEGHASGIIDMAAPDAAARLDALTQSGMDGLVYSVGISPITPIAALSVDALAETLRVNLGGALLATKLALRRAGKGGLSVVWISSVAARRPGGAGMAAYAASKAGLEGACAAAALELARRGVRVNTIVAGAVDTEIWSQGGRDPAVRERVAAQHPLGLGAPLDVALACVYLLSGAARWVTGTTLVVDGGYSIA